ncbi:hypothetical protein E2C01_102538 [Portunus trituberculatus]|uniref:Uncharacterized protein n=1 Tax=Portunus trituberculatus TaxID=210409 RepID=A0A5B7KDK5_PORTR|nr:hypothetical protein [Portunus trituberculatus]
MWWVAAPSKGTSSPTHREEQTSASVFPPTESPHSFPFKSKHRHFSLSSGVIRLPPQNQVHRRTPTKRNN